MASTKALLRDLLACYRESHNDLPEGDKKVTVASGTVYDFDYVAPSNGWLLLTGDSTFCHVFCLYSGFQATATSFSSTASWCAVCLRVEKGCTYRCWAHSSEDATVTFFPEVGA